MLPTIPHIANAVLKACMHLSLIIEYLKGTFSILLTAAATINASSDPKDFTTFNRTKQRRQTVTSENTKKTAVVIMMALLPPFPMASRAKMCPREHRLAVAKMLTALKKLN